MASEDDNQNLNPHQYFSESLQTFMRQVEGLGKSLESIHRLIELTHNKLLNQLEVLADSEGLLLEKAEGEIRVKRPPGYGSDSERLGRRVKRLESTSENFPGMIIVGLVAAFDALVGDLLRSIYYIQPDTINASAKTIDVKTLRDFDSINAAIDFAVDEEIESILRKSHSQIFDTLSNMLGIPLRNELSIWPSFIEITQRRHLLVHARGRVSQTYIRTCKDAGISEENLPNIGDIAAVDRNYIKNAFQVIREVGAKLAQVTWRKCIPDETDVIDTNFSILVLELIDEAEYEFALKLIDFRRSLPKNPISEHTNNVLILNEAQAYKWLGRHEECTEVLNKRDWSAASHLYQLAYFVLSDNFEQAAKQMRQIGQDGTPSKSHYMIWPVFKEFRTSKIFRSAFNDIFGEEPMLTTQFADPSNPQFVYLIADVEKESRDS